MNINLTNKYDHVGIWVCLKIVHPYTQWFCWSLSLLNGYNWGYTPFSDIPICWGYMDYTVIILYLQSGQLWLHNIKIWIKPPELSIVLVIWVQPLSHFGLLNGISRISCVSCFFPLMVMSGEFETSSDLKKSAIAGTIDKLWQIEIHNSGSTKSPFVSICEHVWVRF